MEIRKIQMEDANNYLDMLLNLDNETKFMMFEPWERPTDINIIKNYLFFRFFNFFIILIIFA